MCMGSPDVDAWRVVSDPWRGVSVCRVAATLEREAHSRPTASAIKDTLGQMGASACLVRRAASK